MVAKTELQNIPMKLPNTIEELAELGWKEFQELCISIIESIYKTHGVTLDQTRRVYEEESAHQAQYVLAVGIEEKHGGALNIWLAVKQRTFGDIDRSDIGGLLISAFSEKVAEVIIVTNRTLTEKLGQELDRFAAHADIQPKVIDGVKLVELSQKHLVDHRTSGFRIIEAATEETPGETRTNAPIHTEAWFTLSPYDRRPAAARGRMVNVHPDIPVYLNIKVRIPEGFPASTFRIDVELAQKEAAEIYPFVKRKPFHVFFGGESFSEVYTIWPKINNKWNTDDLQIHLASDHGHHTCDLNFLNNLRNTSLCLNPVELPGQQTLLSDIVSQIDMWSEKSDLSFGVIISPPGLGKSHLLGQIRKYCQRKALSSLFLDCESCRTDADLLRSLFKASLPLSDDFLDPSLRVPIRDWCLSLGLDGETAARIADYLCEVDETASSIDPSYRLFFISALLAQRSRDEPLVLFLEDLHKAMPSVMSLITKFVSSLSAAGDTPILLLATTRPYTNRSSEIRRAWLTELESLIDHCRVYDLQPPTKREARKLLSSTVMGLKDHHYESLIGATGTTPYLIREAVLYLLVKEVFATRGVQEKQKIYLADPRGLTSVLASKELQEATEKRIRLFLNHHPEPVNWLLLAGSVYGRAFPLEQIAKAAGMEDDLDLDRALDACFVWSILRPSTKDVDWIEFDHDLVREAIVLSAPSRSREKIARQLLTFTGQKVSPDLRSRLAFHAGLFSLCLEAVAEAVRVAQAEGRIVDVIEQNNLAIAIIDPDTSDRLLPYVRQDLDSFTDVVLRLRRSDASPLEGATSEQLARLLPLIMENLRCLNSIGSGSGQLSEASITEGRMIAERLGSRNIIAELCYLEGRMWFERGDPNRAVRLHQEAERQFQEIEAKTSQARSENMIRYAICLRQLGEIEESISTLYHSLQYRGRGDWLLINKVRNNLGAAYLRTDWKQVRYHWTKQIDQAERHGLQDRKVHGLASLSFIDVFEGRLQEGLQKIEEGMQIAERLRLDNDKIRLCLNMSVYMILVEKVEMAYRYLLDAERLAIQHRVGRRLWRVIANLSTTHELLGEHDEALIRDMQVLRLLGCDRDDRGKIKRKKALPLVNILFRIETGSPYGDLQEYSEKTAFRVAREYADIARQDRLGDLPGLLGNYCVQLPVGPRFLLIE